MPTYEYRCPDGHAFEKIQKMTDKPRAICPTCRKQATRQISGGAGLVFKGSGFYITDYGKDGKGPRKKDASEAAPSTAGTTEMKAAADSAKPAAAPAAPAKKPDKASE
ncbi:MAG: zinc ribbon domain-containing protein [Gemmatimonadota bacterium]|nr:zinc ribbon domain-containing protein [Gemmatimonadota bacterium]